MAEFLKSYSSAKAYEPTLDTLKKLQSALGVVHDAVAAEQTVSRILRNERSAELAFAAGILHGEFVDPASCCIEKASATHAKLRSSKPFWLSL